MKQFYVLMAAMAISMVSFAQCDFVDNLIGDLTLVEGIPYSISTEMGWSADGEVWGGDQYTVSVTSGEDYTFTFCDYGALANGFEDTQLTIFDESQNVVWYNDDWCDLGSEVVFTAEETAVYTVQVNEYDCITNQVAGNDLVLLWGVSTVGVSEQDASADFDFGLAPNPASQSVTIDLQGLNGEVRIAMNDLSGREVLTTNLDQTQTLDVSQLPAGIYMVHMTQDNKLKTKRLVIE